MKRIIFSGMVLLSFNAFSCPDLTGNFVCKDYDSGSTQDVVVTQSEVDGAINYKIDVTSEGETSSRLYIADGKTRDIESDTYSSRTETATCSGGDLLVDIKGVVAESKESLDATVTINMNDNNDLFNSYIGTQGTRELNFSEVCERVN